MIEVVAAMIHRDGRVLLCRRPEGKNCAGCWEFAGGKIEPNETPQEALRRELREELNVDVSVGAELAAVTHDYPHAQIHLTLYAAEILSGAPTRMEHSAMRWVPVKELKGCELCPADARLVAQMAARGALAEEV